MRHPVRVLAVAAALLAAVLASICGAGATATDDEPTYVGQGAYLVRSGDFYAPVLKWQPPLALYVTSAALDITAIADAAELGRRPDSDSLTDLGDRLLWKRPEASAAVLAASRAPVVLVFAAMAALATWLAARLGGTAAGAPAGLLVAASPMFFSHGGLATTDAVASAAVLLAVAPLAVAAHDGTPWTRRRALLCGVLLGIALLSKHTAVPVAAVVAASIFVLARREAGNRTAAGLAVIALVAAGVAVWAGYGFHTGPLLPADSKGDLARRLGNAWMQDAARTVPVPAPAYWQSLVFQAAKQHDRLYFHYLGEIRKLGWWTYFPVVTLAKATLGSVALLVLAAATLRRVRPSRAEWVLFAAFALPFAAAVASRHNLGVRHVLPALAPLAVLAAIRAGRAWTDATGRAVRIAILLFAALHALEGVTAVKAGVGWWNVAAGGTTAGWRIATGSNADWGQGFARLRQEVDALHLDGDVWVMPAAGPQASRDQLPSMGFRVYRDPTRREPLPESGWLAISTSAWRYAGHDPVTDAPPDHFLAGCFRVYRLPIRERTP